ncbi:group III truncated hemoglobin [Neptunicoccus sediminis]|uniref:group III truncated hemoglobin n=1 Tax=Neptunicoccus sediminis TaxID=1892596 RepID=UPI000845DBDF|nr:group III truncated hemoglobin [Neptunicoccus sediminis]
MPLPPRIPLRRAQIEQVVTAFYARVRRDPVIGPVFLERLSDDAGVWRSHEAKIADFWANAILHERSYNGNPMMVHSGISTIKPQMFARWLDLFDDTLAQELPDGIAAQWSALAHRIGRGLRMGVEMNTANSGPPILS